MPLLAALLAVGCAANSSPSSVTREASSEHGTDSASPEDTGEGGRDGDSGEEPTDGEDSGALASAVAIISDGGCVNPCTWTAQASGDVASVVWSVEGWSLGQGLPPDFALDYEFSQIGPREIVAAGLDGSGSELARDTRTVTVYGACERYTSEEQESAPVQTTGTGVPSGATALVWQLPTTATSTAPFVGTPGSAASHEGIDYVNDDASIGVVPVVAAADGVVVYVREGCPQSSSLGSNKSLRECGAGWGNHVILRHGAGIYTRYAHLEEGSAAVRTGEAVPAGATLASMGNSGRSDVRHLHFELGSDGADPDPCAAAASFAAVYDPARLGL